MVRLYKTLYNQSDLCMSSLSWFVMTGWFIYMSPLSLYWQSPADTLPLLRAEDNKLKWLLNQGNKMKCWQSILDLSTCHLSVFFYTDNHGDVSTCHLSILILTVNVIYLYVTSLSLYWQLRWFIYISSLSVYQQSGWCIHLSFLYPYTKKSDLSTCHLSVFILAVKFIHSTCH